MLFTDKYLLKILSVAIPNDFEPIDEGELLPKNTSALSQTQIEKKQEANAEMKLFTALKLFFKERELDLTEVLKKIRLKK